jgi:RNA polymerase sigma-70 factor (ECF subfamily)
MVMRRCWELLHDEHEVLDITQDVFVQLLRHRDRLRADHPSSLLYRIATNLSLNRIRDRKRRPDTPGDEFLHQIAALDDADARLDARSLLDRAFGRHQESTRTIAVLHFVDGMTLEETAREVGMSVSGIRKRLRALRATLQEIEES